MRQWQPTRPSDELMARLENRPEVHCVSAGSWTASIVRLLALGLGGTVVLAMILASVFWAGSVRVSDSTRPESEACTGSNESVLAVRNEGIYTDAGGRPMQVIELMDLQKSISADPSSGNLIEVIRPRQQLLVTDVETY